MDGQATENRSLKWVADWISSCTDIGVKPWQFDFKRLYLDNPYSTENQDLLIEKAYYPNLHLWLKYKFTKELDKKSPNISDLVDNYSAFEVDKAAFPIYVALGWQKSVNDQINGDTINSLGTTFTQLLSVSNTQFSMENTERWQQLVGDIPNLKSKLQQWGTGEYDQELDQIASFKFATENGGKVKHGHNEIAVMKELERFAALTSSIGNFMVFPSWMNQGRGIGNIHDYWDLALRDMRNFWMEISGDDTFWQDYLNKYYMHEFTYGNGEVVELWSGHLTGPRAYPTNQADIAEYFFNANRIIENRGKKMVCELVKIILEQHDEDIQLNEGAKKLIDAG